MTQLGLVVHDLATFQMQRFFESGKYAACGLIPSTAFVKEMVVVIAAVGVKKHPFNKDLASKEGKNMARRVRMLMETLATTVDLSTCTAKTLVDMVTVSDEHYCEWSQQFLAGRSTLEPYACPRCNETAGVSLWGLDSAMKSMGRGPTYSTMMVLCPGCGPINWLSM